MVVSSPTTPLGIICCPPTQDEPVTPTVEDSLILLIHDILESRVVLDRCDVWTFTAMVDVFVAEVTEIMTPTDDEGERDDF